MLMPRRDGIKCDRAPKHAKGLAEVIKVPMRLGVTKGARRDRAEAGSGKTSRIASPTSATFAGGKGTRLCSVARKRGKGRGKTGVYGGSRC